MSVEARAARPSLAPLFAAPLDALDSPALIAADETLTWADLSGRVEELASQWVGSRRLVMLSGRNSVDLVVAYLAAVAARCPVLLTPPCAAEALASVWQPDIVVDADQGRIDVLREQSCHDLHPDLALLLSTSGSTGSPKLVRLSRDNLQANAVAIAAYLNLTPADRGLTSLPLHYCYGLSILHSHLAVGAAVAVTDASVTDAALWSLAADVGVTGVAGVPHTFELLEHSGFAERDLPRLRYLTQAGGRMERDAVTRWHTEGVRRGWDLFVMYGQTEATARMAWLPPDLVPTHPQAIGRAVPGGELWVEPVEGCAEGVGELVFAGANVMMGYAVHSSDLAEEPMPAVLRTGDLAREIEPGIFEIVGRLKRFAKVFGLRINLDDVERHLGDAGIAARAVGRDGMVTIFVTRRRDLDPARGVVAKTCGIPAWAVSVEFIGRIPHTENGKPDYTELSSLAECRSARRQGPRGRRGSRLLRAVDEATLVDLYADLLGRPDAGPDDSFVSLGADSLSHVELSVRLGELIDPLPGHWHELTIRELASIGNGGRWGRSLDSSVAVRALAILAVVGSHTELFVLTGGAHLLLALAGFNFARFHLGAGTRGALLPRVGWAVAAIAVPSMLWIGAVLAVDERGGVRGDYSPSTLFFSNWLFGSPTWDDRWRFWFLEALIWTLVGIAVLLSVPWVRAIERAHQFAFAAALVALTLGVRWGLVGHTADGVEKYDLPVVVSFFAVGWLLAKAETVPQRLVSLVVVLVSVIGFFDDDRRELLVIAGLLFVCLIPVVRLPGVVASALGVVASASLAIYVTHWQIYPHLEVDHPFLAVVASVAVGVAHDRATRPLVDGVRRLRRTPSSSASRT